MSKQVKQKQKKSQKSELASLKYISPQDKIPGYTTFLYQKNRTRRPEEFVNYWKVDREIEQGLLALDIKRGNEVKKEETIVEKLIDKVSTLKGKLDLFEDNSELSEATSTIKCLREDKSSLFKDTQKLKKTLSERKIEEDKLKKMVQELKSMVMNASESLKTYGYHNSDCNYADMAESGRVFKKQEKELCTCKWSDIKEDIKVFDKILKE